MTIQQRRFFELAVHVKLATEAMIAAARHLSMLEPDGASPDQANAWAQTRDDLVAMNFELGSIERILRLSVRGQVAREGERRTELRGASRARM